MTEEVVDQAPATEAAPAKPRGRAGLKFVLGNGTQLPAIKYPMPVKAPRKELTVDGETVECAYTTFTPKDKPEILYTYVMYKGASFYIPGHITNDDGPLSFAVPEGYSFKPSALDRKTMVKPKKAKAEGEAAPAEGPTEAAPQESAEAPAEAVAEAPKGKKAKRG